jgi:micrococcal nuclease
MCHLRLAVSVLALLLAVVVLVAPALAAPSTAATPSPIVETIPASASEATVASVSDGDTIRVDLGGETKTVRLILIDTPETRKPNSPVECFGAEATARVKALLPAGTTVYLERDVSETDRYGRLLRYVWVPEGGRGQGYLLDERLVREGYAALYTYPPDVKYVDRIRAAQQAAVAEQAGLWSKCGGTDTPLTGPAPLPSPPLGARSVTGGGPIGADRDCGDFATQADAQAFYEAAGGPAVDPDRLDADGNGIACESLP